MTMPKMDHVATVTGDGSVHVQNLLGGYLGQHFRMTAENFAAWRQMLRTRYGDEVSDPTPGQWCACGLEAGQCRDDKGAVHPAWQPSPLDELYQRCKDIADADGGWPGSEVVDIVVDILTRHRLRSLTQPKYLVVSGSLCPGDRCACRESRPSL